MSAISEQFSTVELRPEAEDKCKVAVLYANTAARERGISLCHHLVHEFWAQIDFEFSWWRFRYLADADLAQAASRAAADADMVSVSGLASESLPGHVQDWLDRWLPVGKAHDAVVIVLADTANPVKLSASPLVAQVAEAAHRVNLDCLLPPGAPGGVSGPDPLGLMHDRATHVTEVLDEILHHISPPPTQPSHWGLNE